jgi:hypothetical protein
MIYKAKALAVEPENRFAFNEWSKANQDVSYELIKHRECPKY